MIDEGQETRRRVYALLITVAAGMVAGRILATELVLEPSLHKPVTADKSDRRRVWPKTPPRAMPSFGSNDRSRWATVRALVDGDPAIGQPRGTFVIGRRDRGITLASAIGALAANDPLQAAIFMSAGYQARVKSDRGIIFEDGWQSVDKVLQPGTLQFYSSKPPFLSVLVAGLYGLLQLITGWTLAEHPFAVMRTILLLLNLLPFVIYLVLLSRLIERHGRTDWGRFFTMACACFATYLTTFAVTFNNHTLAAYGIVFALYPLLSAPEEPAGGGWLAYVVAGFFASFAACCELPAASFAAALGVYLLWRSPLKTMVCFLPAAAVPVAFFLFTNYLAMGEWRPAYEKFDNSADYEWYQFEGSHWRKPPSGQIKHGIDWARGHESRGTYALHVLVGHHGLFSLTPIWLLALLGMLRFSFAGVGCCVPKENRVGSYKIQSLVALLTLMLTVVVIGFYLVKSDNYGGWTSGLRWLIWLSPLWLLCLLPVADRLADRMWTRGLAYVLLAFSVLSVSYPAWNPWRHPWIYRFMEALGWPGY